MSGAGALAHLVELGLSEYEGRAYLALLEKSPATAYETARASGIPTSKIYEVLGRMASRGLVMAIDEGERRLYVPQEAREFLDAQKSRFNETLSALQKDISQLPKPGDISYLWNVKDRSGLIDRAISAIDRSTGEIILSAWPEELAELSRALEAAAARGVKIAVVHFGTPRAPCPGALYVHPIPDTLQSEKGGRGFALVRDAHEALIGTIYPDEGAEGVWSQNRGFVLLTEDYVKHDVYIMKIVRRYDEELIRRFGDNYHLMRDVFNDREL